MSVNILENKEITFTNKSIHYKIPLCSIIYIESSKRKCIIHTTKDFVKTDTELSFYEKLDDLSELLCDYGFVRCHQSYLVSLQRASTYHKKFLIVEEHDIPVSERYRSDIIKLFDNPSEKLIPSTTQTHAQTIGILVCINGEYKGSITRIYPDIDYELGRDGNACEIVINLPYISRKHAVLTYHANQSYTITDHSHNGTYVIEENGIARKLTADKIETVPSGSVICFGDRDLQYRIL